MRGFRLPKQHRPSCCPLRFIHKFLSLSLLFCCYFIFFVFFFLPLILSFYIYFQESRKRVCSLDVFDVLLLLLSWYPRFLYTNGHRAPKSLLSKIIEREKKGSGSRQRISTSVSHYLSCCYFSSSSSSSLYI